MNSFKQALNLLKVNLKDSLLFGFVAMLFIFLARVTPWVGAFVLSLVILIFQNMAQNIIINKKSTRQVSFEGKELVSYLIIAICLFPTSALFGSAVGLVESPQGYATTLPLSLLLMIFASYFYFVLSQALRLHLEDKVSIAKSIDIVGIASVKNIKTYLIISVYAGILVLISAMTKGAGLIATLPLIFFTNYYLYLEMHLRFKPTAHAPQ